MHREGEDVRIALGAARVEYERGAVAVMDVEVHDRHALDPSLLKHADGDRDVVEGAEALAVVREGVMETAADVSDGVGSLLQFLRTLVVCVQWIAVRRNRERLPTPWHPARQARRVDRAA